MSLVVTAKAHIVSVGQAFPQYYYSQEELVAALLEQWGEHFHNPRRLQQIHENVLVGGRHLALPMERYADLSSFDESNATYREVATELGEAAVRDALDRAGLEPKDVDHLFFVSVTGVSTPSIDARLVARMGMRADVKRTPIFGLGCVAGVSGVARVADVLAGNPEDVAVLLSVELCSLTLQRKDLTMANIISSGLFGDGAAAVVMTGRNHVKRGPEVRDSRAKLYPNTEGIMGWNIGSSGFQVVLSPEVPSLTLEHLGRDVSEFLQSQGLENKDVDRWISHTGGPKVLNAIATALNVPSEALELTWKSLRERGNLSSASVLLVLRETLAHRRDGQWAMMLAMGPGFCSELVLLKWN